MNRALLAGLVLLVGCGDVTQVDPSTLTSGTALVGEETFAGPVNWRVVIDSNAISQDLLTFSGVSADQKQLRVTIPMRGVGDWVNDELKVKYLAGSSPDPLSPATVGNVDYVVSEVDLVINSVRATGTVSLYRKNQVQGEDTDNQISTTVNFALGSRTCIVDTSGSQTETSHALCTTRWHR